MSFYLWNFTTISGAKNNLRNNSNNYSHRNTCSFFSWKIFTPRMVHTTWKIQFLGSFDFYSTDVKQELAIVWSINSIATSVKLVGLRSASKWGWIRMVRNRIIQHFHDFLFENQLKHSWWHLIAVQNERQPRNTATIRPETLLNDRESERLLREGVAATVNALFTANSGNISILSDSIWKNLQPFLIFQRYSRPFQQPRPSILDI